MGSGNRVLRGPHDLHVGTFRAGPGHDFGRGLELLRRTDPELAAQGPFGTLVASGWQIASLSMRVFVQAGGYGSTPVVGMGIDELRWLKPVRAGDQLTVTREIVELRRSESNPTRGIIRTQVTVRNQDGERAMTLVTTGRVPARPHDSSKGNEE